MTGSSGFVRSELAALSRAELSPDQVMDSITAHIEKRLQDERERIAQAIEAGTPSPGDAYHAGGFVAGERVGMQRAARIARAES